MTDKFTLLCGIVERLKFYSTQLRGESSPYPHGCIHGDLPESCVDKAPEAPEKWCKYCLMGEAAKYVGGPIG